MSPKLTRPYSTRNANNITHFKVKRNFFKNTFFSQLSLNETNWTLKLKLLLALIFPKRTF